MPGRRHTETRRQVHARSRSNRRRRDAARRRDLAQTGETVAGIPVLEIGRRIEAYARNPLADLLRESYWKAKGASVWKRVCKNSLRERSSSSWVWVVRRLGGA